MARIVPRPRRLAYTIAIWTVTIVFCGATGALIGVIAGSLTIGLLSGVIIATGLILLAQG